MYYDEEKCIEITFKQKYCNYNCSILNIYINENSYSDNDKYVISMINAEEILEKDKSLIVSQKAIFSMLKHMITILDDIEDVSMELKNDTISLKVDDISENINILRDYFCLLSECQLIE